MAMHVDEGCKSAFSTFCGRSTRFSRFLARLTGTLTGRVILNIIRSISIFPGIPRPLWCLESCSKLLILCSVQENAAVTTDQTRPLVFLNRV